MFTMFAPAAKAEGADTTDAPPQSGRTLKVLGIGNSYLINATNNLPGLAQAAGHNLILGRAAPGGRTLQNHYDAAMLAESEPDNPGAMIYEYQGQKMNLKEMLQAEEWDVVTIQQSSPNSFKIETYRPHAEKLTEFIRQYAPQAEVVFHQTWPWRPDHTRQNMHENPPGFMYKELTKAYHTIAKEIGIERITPVGNAFQLAAESPEWKFSRDPEFDYENPKYPEMPNEKNSLNRGFRWRSPPKSDQDEETVDPSKMVFRLDGSHANGNGGYLAACVWFEFLFDEDVRTINVNPGYLGERAASLREIAHRTVSGQERPKAWPTELE